MATWTSRPGRAWASTSIPRSWRTSPSRRPEGTPDPSWRRPDAPPVICVTEAQGRACYPGPVERQGRSDGAGRGAGMSDAARIAQLEAELAASRAREAALAVDVAQRDRALGEALDQQIALAEVLRVIAASPTDQDNVLAVVAASAARL